MQKGNDCSNIAVPAVDDILNTMEKDPDSCTCQEKAAMKFFYQQALLVVEANVSSKDIWVEHSTYMKVLGDDWNFVMATACILIAEYSDQTNILENLQGNSSQSGSDSDDGATRKKKRARLHNKKEKKAARDAYYKFCLKFSAMKKDEAAKHFIDKWDQLCGPAANQGGKKGAATRQTIAPTDHHAGTSNHDGSAGCDFAAPRIQTSVMLGLQ